MRSHAQSGISSLRRFPIAAVSLQAFADESGTHDGAEYCLIAGYVATPAVWGNFQRQWESILTEHGAEELHAVKFFARDGFGQRVRPYKDWSDKKSTDFIQRCVQAIIAHDIAAIGIAVNVKAFHALGEGERRVLTGANWENGGWLSGAGSSPKRPYFFGFYSFVVEASKQCSPGDVTDYVFDINEAVESRAVQAFAEVKKLWDVHRGNRLGAIAYQDSRSQPALQAADLLAYCWQRKLAEGNKFSGERKAVMDYLVADGKTIGGGSLYILDEPHLQFILEQISPDQLAGIRAWQPKKSKASRVRRI